MRNLYLDTNKLDARCVSEYGLKSEILMENAASVAKNFIKKRLTSGSSLLVVCGGGNNAADGLCLARMLSGEYIVSVMLVSQKLNEMAKFQLEILKRVGVSFVSEISEFDCIVDAIYGSGFRGELSSDLVSTINSLNAKKALKVALDFPTGLYKNGSLARTTFKAHATITMGALKLGLFSDLAKDFTGEIKVANLGVSRDKFEVESDYFLLQKSDLKLPFREMKNCNKGDFGHLYVVSGDMSGASIIAGLAGSAFGAGLVSLVGDKKIENLPPILMQKSSLQGAKVVVAGCGLGRKEFDFSELTDKKSVIDADLFYKDGIIDFLSNSHCAVITPHPKEFTHLLKLANIANISVSDLQENRFKYAKIWSEKFKGVLVLKGTNTIITQNSKLFISNLGSNALAKGGSGDALAGMIGALLAQGESPLNSAINAVLAHALAGRNFSKNNYSLNPIDIIEGVKCL